MTEATPRPWAVIQDQYGNESIVDSMGDFVVEMAEQTIDADLIVKAVNNHDALVAEATELLKNTTWDEDSVGYARVLTQDIEALNAALEQVK